jgi:lipopolysaccharide transport system ATP-binding protein
MYVRLAFAVAAHLDSDILIADEVLAVGDAEFQKKALGRMRDLSTDQGRTVLFVSHNMGAVKNLCERGIILEKGRIKLYSTTDKIIERYLLEQTARSQTQLHEIQDRTGNGLLRFTSIVFIDASGNSRETFEVGEEINIKIFFDYSAEMEKTRLSHIDIGINDLLNTRVLRLSSYIFTDKIDFKKGYICFKIPELLLMTGTYNINIYCETDFGAADHITNVSKINVVYNDFYKTGRECFPGESYQGYIVSKFFIE